MNEDLISEFIKECTKNFNEIKKKNNSDINKSLDLCLTNLSSLKEKISIKDMNSIVQISLSITNSFIDACNNIITLKYSKYFLNILSILKKFIEYKLFSQEKSNDIILLSKSFFNSPKIDDNCKKKLMEIIQAYIFSEYFEIKYDSLSIIYIIILKEFNITNHSKNKDFKNPIRLLFTIITDKIYKSNNIQIILKITHLIFSCYDLSLSENNNKKNHELNYIDNNDDLKNEIKEIISKNKNTVYIQSLSLELMSQGFSNYIIEIKNNNIDLINDELNNFINEKIISAISSNIDTIKNNYSLSDDELNYLNYLKICKFLKILFFNYNTNYDVIQTIIEIMNDQKNRQNKLFWKINLSFNLLVQIISNYELLSKIYLWNKEKLKNIFSSLNDLLIYINNNSFDKNKEENKQRDIFENKIYLEGDEISVLKEEDGKYYKNLINESIKNLIDSLMKLKINIGNKNSEKEIFCEISDYLRDIIYKLLSQEFYNKRKVNDKINDTIKNEYNEEIKKYINYIKSFIILYNNINNCNKKNETLKFLCELSLDYEENNTNEETNIFIAIYLLDFTKEVNLLDKDSFVILLQTIEVFNRKYNYLKLNEYIKKDIYRIINDMNTFLDPKYQKLKIKKPTKIRIEIKIKEENEQSDKNEIVEKIEIEKGIKKKESKEEDNSIKSKLCRKINELFMDTKIYNFESIKCIIDSLCTCIDLSIQKMKNHNDKNNIDGKQDIIKVKIINNNNLEEEKRNNFTYEINFYFTKILSLTLLYLDNIYILFEPFISVVNKLIDNKLMIEFSVDVLCALIPEILIKYEKIKTYINKNINEENKIWINEKWQKVLFSPLLTLLSQPELFSLLKPKIFISIKKIIQNSGNFIDSYGWDAILQACIILSNYNLENSFLIIKEILNDYNGYLTIFNVTPLMKLLKLFVSEEKDKNMNYSSVELFWSCANIIDDYIQGKRILNENQKLYFNNIMKGREIKIYCEELYINLFSYLIEINTNSSIDVRKSMLNTFTEIFVTKFNSFSCNNCLKIVNDIFFKVFEINSDKYALDNKNSKLEKILEISLFCIIKIIKEFLNENEKQTEIYEKYLNKLIEIIPTCSNLLINDILKSLIEIKISKNENTPIIETKIENYFKILSLINIHLKSPNFVLDKNNKAPLYRLFRSLLSYLEYMPKAKINSNENSKIIFDILDTLLNYVYELEIKLLESKPTKILDFENEIFIFLEKINIEKNIAFNFLLDKMNLNLQNPHSEAICKRSFESFQNLINNKINNNKIFGIEKQEKEIIFIFIEKIKNIMNFRDNNKIIETIYNSSINKNNIKEEIHFDKYLQSFIKIIDEICKNFIKIKEDKLYSNEKERNDIINNISDIFLSILDSFEMMFKQSISGYQSINKSYYYIIVDDVYQQMDIISYNFIINKFIFYFLIILGDENKDIFEKIEKKFINLVKLISRIIYDNNKNYGDSSFISLNQFYINELFNLCKYKTNEQIINIIHNYNIKINEEIFIKNYINISKTLTHLLIQKIIETLKKYIEDENKSGGMPLNRGRIYEIITLLNNVKELEIFPHFYELKMAKFKKEEEKEINTLNIISENKKMHLFYIQPILNDFIFCKENSIKSLVKDIFNEFANIINLPKLINFDE